MQPRTRRIPLLLLPLLAAACAPAVASHAGAPAPDRLTARRAGNNALVVNTSQPVYAYVLEMRPDREEVLQLLNGGEATELAPGRQRLDVGAAAGETSTRAGNVQYNGDDRRYCGPGERLSQSGAGPGPLAGAQSTMRAVNVRGKRLYCERDFIRASASTTNNRQALVVLASAEPVSPRALLGVIATLNTRFATAQRSADAIFSITRQTLRERGIEAYAVRAR
jgi:hypothetical protein